LDPKTHAVRIAAQVGKKKKMEIMKKAEELGIKVLNPIKYGEENVPDGKRE